jgi:hypothetical protein
MKGSLIENYEAIKSFAAKKNFWGKGAFLKFC